MFFNRDHRQHGSQTNLNFLDSMICNKPVSLPSGSVRCSSKIEPTLNQNYIQVQALVRILNWTQDHQLEQVRVRVELVQTSLDNFTFNCISIILILLD
jgi:ribosomal protein L11